MSFSQKAGKFTEYIFTRLFIGTIGLIPFEQRARFLEKLSVFIGKRLKSTRNRILTNLQYAFPEKGPEQLEQLLEANLCNLGRLGAEFIESPRINEKFIKRYMVFADEDRVFRAYHSNCIMITGHLGNWEWMGSAINYMRDDGMYAFAKRQHNPWMNRFIEETRARQRIGVVYTDESPRRGMRILKNGGLIAFVADQDAGRNGRFFNFFNRPASTYIGPAMFARISQAQIFFTWSYHNEKRQLVMDAVELKRPVTVDPAKDPTQWEDKLTETWVKLLEEKARQHPEDYFWIHQRWRTRPETQRQPPSSS